MNDLVNAKTVLSSYSNGGGGEVTMGPTPS
jgi:hypothetical protein